MGGKLGGKFPFDLCSVDPTIAIRIIHSAPAVGDLLPIRLLFAVESNRRQTKQIVPYPGGPLGDACVLRAGLGGSARGLCPWPDYIPSPSWCDGPLSGPRGDLRLGLWPDLGVDPGLLSQP